MGPAPTNLRCLRPLSSGLTASSKPPLPTQGFGTLGPSKTTSPVLQVPIYSKVKFGEGNCPSNFGSNQTTSPGSNQTTSTCNSKVQKDLANASAECKLNYTSGTKFKFVNRHPATLPSGGVPHDEDLDNELFLDACMDLDNPDSLLYQEPSRPDFQFQGQMADNSVSERVAAAKRLRTTSSIMPMNLVGSNTFHLDRTRNKTLVGGISQPVETSPKSALRPSAMGPCLPQSNLGINTSPAAHPNFSCQTPKQPFQTPMVRSYSPSCSVTTPLRPATPQIHSQNSFMPRMANSGAQLLTTYGPVAPPPATPKAPCSTGSAGNLQTPVVTNHLVRLVTAVNKTPQLTGRLSSRAKTRRFPGPAGILPHHVRGLAGCRITYSSANCRNPPVRVKSPTPFKGQGVGKSNSAIIKIAPLQGNEGDFLLLWGPARLCKGLGDLERSEDCVADLPMARKKGKGSGVIHFLAPESYKKLFLYASHGSSAIILRLPQSSPDSGTAWQEPWEAENCPLPLQRYDPMGHTAASTLPCKDRLNL